MADDDLEDLTSARRVLTETRHNLAKTIGAGYKREEAETTIKGLIQVQQAIEVIDIAIEELEEAQLEEFEDETEGAEDDE